MTQERQKNEYMLALGAIILTVIVGGAAPVLVKISLREIPPFSFTLLRFVIGGLCLLPFIKSWKGITFSKLLTVVVISLFATVNVTLFAFGIKLTGATIGQTLYAGVPIAVAILSFFLLREKISVRKSVGIIIGLAGVLLIIFLPAIAKGQSLNGDLLGNIIILAALISFSFYTVYSKKLQQEFTPVQVTFFFAATTVVTQFFLSFSEITSGNNWWQHVSMPAILSLLYVGVIGTVGYYVLYQYAIKHGTPLIASMAMYLQPVTTFAWAAVLLGERLTGGFIIGAVLALLGVWITTNAKRK